MKVSNIIIPFLLLGLFSVSFGQALFDAEAEGSDSLDIMTLAYYHYGIQMSPRMSLQAKIQLWLWENQDRLGQSFTLQYRVPRSDKFLPSFGLSNESADPYDIPGFVFQQSDSYVKDQFRLEGMSEDARTNRPVMLPIMAIASSLGKWLSKFGDNENSLPLRISLSDDQIRMLSILWDQPDMSTERWYMRYVELGFGKRVPYLEFERLANKLENDGYVRYRISSHSWLQSISGPIRKYTAIFNRKTILLALRQESINSDVLSSGTRHFDVIRMQTLLNDRDLIQ